MIDLNTLAKEIHENAVAHGWWETERPPEEIIALIHSEWSEALEEYRAGRPMVWHGCCRGGACDGFCGEPDCYGHANTKPEGIAVELIDGCISILDWLAKQGVTFSKYATLDRLANHPGVTNDVPLLVCNLHEMTSQTYSLMKRAKEERIKRITEYRPYNRTTATPESIQSNLIYAMIYACTFIKSQGIDPEAVLLEKHEYNTTSPYMHGGKIC